MRFLTAAFAFLLVAACGGEPETGDGVDDTQASAETDSPTPRPGPLSDRDGDGVPRYAEDGVRLGEVRGDIEDYPAPNVSDEEIICMAMGLYHEARAEPEAGLWAVGNVVLNRMEDPRYPDTACGVTKDGGNDPPCQFSWYCDGRSDAPKEPEAWENARVLARKLLTGELPDVTDGATSFHAISVSPGWATCMERTNRIGGHIFYRSR